MSETTESIQPSPSLANAENDAQADVVDLKHRFVDGAIALLETGLASAEGDGEKLVPEFEQGVIQTAETFVPAQLKFVVSMIAGYGNAPIASMNLQLDAAAKAHLAIAIGRLKTVQAQLGG